MQVLNRKLLKKTETGDWFGRFCIRTNKTESKSGPDRLALNCLGKDFLIDRTGEMVSECHVNPRVLIPLLRYILHCQGKELSEEWVMFGELHGAADWSRFFSHRCEDSLHQLADAHQEIVFEILHLFGAQPLPATIHLCETTR
jgi:hypothetical protein